MSYKDIIDNDRKIKPQHFRFLLHKNKNIIGPFLDNNLNNVDIGSNSISDNFVPVRKDKINFLFAGCSITVGCGLNSIKRSWSYKLYESININDRCSGYFNVGLSGGSPIEIMINVLKYISKYGCPDYIFILFPNFGRDWYKFNTFHGPDEIKNGEIVESFIFNLYSILEDICKINNTKLFVTSWTDLVEGITDYLSPNLMKEFEKYMHSVLKESFSTYYQIDNKRFKENVFSYIQNNDRSMTIIGNDNVHPSEAVHYGWFKEAEFQMNKYKDHLDWLERYKSANIRN